MSKISQVVSLCGQLLRANASPVHTVKCARCLSMSTQKWRGFDGRTSQLAHRHASTNFGPYNLSQNQVRTFSNQKNFLKDLFDNVMQDMKKSKEMKENLKKFRSEAEKLEQSEALQKAREKFDSIESETSKGSEVFKEKVAVFQDKLKETLTEAEKTELGQKGKQIFESVGETAKKTAESVGKSTEAIAKSQVFKTVAEGAKAVKSEIDEVTLSRARVYKPPVELRKRQMSTSEKEFEADTEATEMVMHRDSRFSQAWSSFKENNQFVHKMFDMKTKYDESDHLVVRATRAFTDKLSGVFGGLFQPTPLSEVMTEICKVDPNFDKEAFIAECHTELIPNILEAKAQGDLEILEDWCYEAAFNVMAAPLKQAKQEGKVIESQVIDISQVDIVGGTMMDQGPVLLLTFWSQEIKVVRDMKGNIKEGDPDKVLKTMNIWAFCRDQSVLDPKAAWRLIEASAISSSEVWL